jgi:hypothetical protein
VTGRIPLDEVAFDATSYVDPRGRVFRWNGFVLRAVPSEHAEFFRGLVAQPGPEWTRHLVDTEATDLQLEGYGLVLRHREIRPRTYCVEWPPEMLRAAGEITLELAIEALDSDLMLQDAYPWNVLFEGTRPVFVDLGSLRPSDEEERFLWQAYGQFCNFFLFPMYLYAAGHHSVVRRLLYDFLNGVSHEQCSRLLPLGQKLRHPQVWSRLELPLRASRMVDRLGAEERVGAMLRDSAREAPGRSARKAFLQGLLRDLRAVRVPAPKGVWSDYYEEWPDHDNAEEWSPKQVAVASVLRRLRPATVVDAASNRGWYSLLAAREGARVVAFDTDESSVSWLYRRAADTGADVQPLVIDLLNPPPAFGWKLQQFPSSLERLSTEMVFAFALLHHLVLTQWQDFERVAALLDCLVKKWLLIEFIPLDDDKARILLARHQRDAFDWYTLENLDRALARYFPHREVLESHPPGRRLILCGRDPLP